MVVLHMIDEDDGDNIFDNVCDDTCDADDDVAKINPNIY